MSAERLIEQVSDPQQQVRYLANTQHSSPVSLCKQLPSLIQFIPIITIIDTMRKILVSSDCNGNLDFLFFKIEALQKKNSFDFVLCIGSVFSSLPSFKADTKIHIPIFFIDSGELGKSLSTLYPEGHEVVPNLTFLGRSGIKDILGVKIAYLNGVENTRHPGFYGRENVAYSSNYFTYEDVEDLVSYKSQKIDILLTNNWPMDSSRQPQFEAKHQSQYVSKIAGALAPRYHFAAMESTYYKREEYSNHKGYSTVFISVAPIQQEGDNKAKYLHAIQIVPFSGLTEELQKKDNLAKDPFGEYSKEATQESTKEAFSKYLQTGKTKSKAIKDIPLTVNAIIYFEKFISETHTSEIQEFLQRWGEVKQLSVQKGGCGTVVFKDINTARQCLADSGKYSLYGKRIRFSLRNANNKMTEPTCWFCPQSNVFDHSLMVLTGRKIYMAVDKGPITPEHFQVVPYPHIESLSSCEKDISDEIDKLILKVESRLKNRCFITYTSFISLQFSKNHAVMHCIPIPDADTTTLSSLFQRKVNNEKLGFLKIKEQEVTEHIGRNYYFKIQIGKSIYVKLIKDKFFPVDFGRVALCEILGLPERVNWKGCIDQEETERYIKYYKQLLA